MLYVYLCELRTPTPSILFVFHVQIPHHCTKGKGSKGVFFIFHSFLKLKSSCWRCCRRNCCRKLNLFYSSWNVTVIVSCNELKANEPESLRFPSSCIHWDEDSIFFILIISSSGSWRNIRQFFEDDYIFKITENYFITTRISRVSYSMFFFLFMIQV